MYIMFTSNFHLLVIRKAFVKKKLSELTYDPVNEREREREREGWGEREFIVVI